MGIFPKIGLKIKDIDWLLIYDCMLLLVHHLSLILILKYRKT